MCREQPQEFGLRFIERIRRAACRAELRTGISLVKNGEDSVENKPRVKGHSLFGRLLRWTLGAVLIFLAFATGRSVNWTNVWREISATQTGVQQHPGKPATSDAPRKGATR